MIFNQFKVPSPNPSIFKVGNKLMDILFLSYYFYYGSGLHSF